MFAAKRKEARIKKIITNTSDIILQTVSIVIFQNRKSNQAIETKPVVVQLDIQSEEAAPAGYIDVSDETDSTVVFVAQAADIGSNNYGIVGDFVLKGEVLAKGVRKEGFCSIINQTITLGMNAETPLLQAAIREKGYFFRQYPLVSNSEAIDNKPKGKSIRRALAIRNSEIIWDGENFLVWRK